MIVTHTSNAEGHRRVYLGGKASLECWIQPAVDGTAWTFYTEVAPGRYPLSNDDLRAWATHMLLALSEALHVAPDELLTVPFDRIAALHCANPLDHRRIAVPRRQTVEHGYMSTAPHITRPQADFRAEDFARAQHRRR